MTKNADPILGAVPIGGALAARRMDGAAAAISLPCLGWVCFAGLLSEELWRRNEAPEADQASA